jgi:DNA-binding beta-propeller fold protein YncE
MPLVRQAPGDGSLARADARSSQVRSRLRVIFGPWVLAGLNLALLAVSDVLEMLGRRTPDAVVVSGLAAFALLVLSIPIHAVLRHRRHTAIAAVAAMLLVPLWFVGSIFADAYGHAHQPWVWRAEELTLPNGLGTVAIASRPMEPPSYSNFMVPGDDRNWRFEVRRAGREARYFDLQSGYASRMRVELGTHAGHPVVSLRPDEDGGAGPDYHVDLVTGAQLTAPPAERRKLATYVHETGFVPYTTRPAAAGGLWWPSAVAVDAAGDVYVADSGNLIIASYSSDGRLLRTWPAPGGIYAENDMTFDPQGHLWVGDWGQKGLWEYDREGKPFRSCGTLAPDAPVGSEPSPDYGQVSGMACDGAGNLYLTDIEGYVRKVAPDGRILARWGQRSNTASHSPCGVAVTPEGEVVVADRNASLLLWYSTEGKLLRTRRLCWNRLLTDGPAPLDVACDAAGNLYVAVERRAQLEIWTYGPRGRRVRKWATGCHVEGYARRLAVTGHSLYVADRDGHRVLKFTTDGVPVAGWGATP